MKNKRLLSYNITYFSVLIISTLFSFLPWNHELWTDYFGVEILHLIPLYVLTICFVLASSILYIINYLYSIHRAINWTGFGLGLGGSIIGVISGTFGIYYFFTTFRSYGLIMLGSLLYWLWDALIMIFCIFICVENRRVMSKTVPVTDL